MYTDDHHIRGSRVLRVFEKLLKKVFGSKREGVTCDWKNKKIVELYDLYTYSWSNIIIVMK
jgi:hypothetical protein